MLPIVRTFISLPAGIARMNVWRFSILSFLGALPWCFALAWAGYVLGENWEDISDYLRPVSIPIAIAVFLFGCYFVYRRVREIRGAQHDTLPPEELGAGPR
jgi:membrane protein DedA with SNARE-associated domain